MFLENTPGLGGEEEEEEEEEERKERERERERERRFPSEIKDQCYRRTIANDRNVQSVCCSCRDTNRARSRGIFTECVHLRLALRYDTESANTELFEFFRYALIDLLRA